MKYFVLLTMAVLPLSQLLSTETLPEFQQENSSHEMDKGCKKKTYSCLTVTQQLNACNTVFVGGVNIAPLVSLITANSFSYGSLFDTTNGQAISNNGFATFSNNGPCAGGVLPLMNGSTVDNTAITLSTAGVYKIEFAVRGTFATASAPLVFNITSGTIISPTIVAQFASNTATPNTEVLVVNGSIIVSLPAQTVLRLQNVSGGTVTTSAVNAGVTTGIEFSVQRVA